MGLQKEDYGRIALAVGTGSNDFSMSRGSFRYRKKDSKPQKLFLQYVRDERQTDEGAVDELVFTGKNGAEYLLTIRTKGECQEISLSPGEGNRFEADRFYLTIPCGVDEHFYGCGETYSEFDLAGQKVRIWVAEHQNAKRIAMKLIRQKLSGVHPERTLPFKKYESYYAQPTFTSSAKYYVHAELSAYSEFDFTKKGQITFYTQELPRLVMESAGDFGELSYKLSERLGRQRTLPDWIYDGAILAVQDWTVGAEGTVSAENGTAHIDEKLKRAKDAGAAVCGIWSQDWCGCRCTKFGYQVMWNWEYDEKKYPGLPAKIAEWKAEGVRFLGYINPFLALEKELYAEASQKGYCVKDRSGKDYLVTITTFPAAMVDFTNPEAYAWYKEIIKKNMIGIGMGGWMADFGEYLPVDCVLHSGEDPERLHNSWPAIWARLNREAIEECGVADEVFFFTRAGHTGTIAASAMMWTGDQHVDWSVDDGLASVIPATLSLAMSGYGITHSDVGGYTTIMQMTRSEELLLRWEEMNAFTPLYRFHEGNQPSRDVQFDGSEALLTQLSVFSRIHRGLKPYLTELVKEQTERGTPVMRPLFYHYDEGACYTEKTEYLLGADLLVAPVYLPGQTARTVYLPEDEWVHLFTGKRYSGGTYEVEAPIGMPPVFVRQSSPRAAALLSVKAFMKNEA